MSFAPRQRTFVHGLAAVVAVSGALLYVLKGGPTPSQVGAGVLLTQSGATVTDTRASSKTCNTNASGSTVVVLGNNQPCVDTVGLNVEGAATNLILYSQDYTQTAWAKGNNTITAASGTAPDGTNTLQLVTDTTATGVHQLQQALTGLSNVAYTASYYVQFGTINCITVIPLGNAASNYGIFNLSNGTIAFSAGTGNNATMKALGGGLYRISVSATETAATDTTYLQWNPSCTNALNVSYTGTSGTTRLWGSQFETGTVATSYVATTGTTATRAADVTNAGSVALGSTPSFSADITVQESGTLRTVIDINDGLATQWRASVLGGDTFICQFQSGNNVTAGNVTAGVKTHVSCSYDGANYKACVAGVCSSAAQSIAGAASYSTTSLGNTQGGINQLFGQIANVCVSRSPTGCP